MAKKANRRQGGATVTASGINPPIPEYLWDKYPDDQELLDAVQPMTLTKIPFAGGEGPQWLYEWMQVEEHQGELLIIPTTTAQQNPPFNGIWGNSYKVPKLADEAADEAHQKLMDRFFTEILKPRTNINSHQNEKAAAWFADMLDGVRQGGYITNPVVLDIYEFGGGTPWRQLTVQDITNERQRRDDAEQQDKFEREFDQDVATVDNEVLTPSAAEYNEADYRSNLGGDALTKWDELRAARAAAAAVEKAKKEAGK